MAKPQVSDALWEAIAPLLPPEPPTPNGGRPRIADRAALTGIPFVLSTGLPWEYLRQELRYGSGITCWRCLREWQQAGVWHRLHRVLLDRRGEADRIDWSRASRIRRIAGSAGSKNLVAAAHGFWPEQQYRTRHPARTRARAMCSFRYFDRGRREDTAGVNVTAELDDGGPTLA